MGLISRLRTNFLQAVLRAAGASTLDSYLWGDAWSSASVAGVHVNQLTSLNAAAVMACVTMLAEDIAKLTPLLYRKDARGKRTDATDHWLYGLLEEPNEWQNWLEFCEQMQVGLILRGNAYAAIIRNGRGIPIRLVPINPDWIALWETPDGGLFYRVTAQGLHLLAMLRDLPTMIPADDMLHVKGFSLTGLVGASRITLAREAIGLLIAQEQQAARWMGNSARPSGMLTTDQKLATDAAARMKADIKENWTGLQNSGRIIVGEQGLKFQPFSMTSADLEFIASRQFQLSEIARIFRVPPHMIGDLSRSTNNNIVQQSQEYVNYTLSGYTRRWERKLATKFGLRKDGVFLDFDMTEITRADITSRYNNYRVGIMSMFITPNEARIDDGRDPLDGGDELQKPMNMGAMGSQSGGVPDDAGRPPNGEMPKHLNGHGNGATDA